MSKKDNGKNKTLFTVLITAIVVAIIAIVVCFFLFRGEKELKNPLPPIDTNVVLSSEPVDHVQVEEGGGSVLMNYKTTIEISLSSGEVKMQFENPGDSSHDAALELYVVSEGKDYLVADSGRIPAGGTLEKMNLVADGILSTGRYNAKYVVKYYDPETGEKALVDSNIEDITLIVTE